MAVVTLSKNNISWSSSNLNPNAPMFVPSSYREVEDFSDQWWELVHSSPCFRDYWLRECFADVDIVSSAQDHIPDSALPRGQEDKVDVRKELVSLGVLKWRKMRGGGGPVEAPRYIHKFPKIVKVKVSPRPIQQPR